MVGDYLPAAGLSATLGCVIGDLGRPSRGRRRVAVRFISFPRFLDHPAWLPARQPGDGWAARLISSARFGQSVQRCMAGDGLGMDQF